MYTSSLYPVAYHALEQGWSVIPLRGGNNLTMGKRPAIKQWSGYQLTSPTPNDLHQWFEVDSYSAYGIVCGQVSGVVILDVDTETTLSLLQEYCPQLLETRTIQSGGRGLPHLYWKVDFLVKTQKLKGADLKGEGSYVVGAGSKIAGQRWTIIKDVPIRLITPEELALVCDLLKLPKEENPKMELVTPGNPYYLGKAEIQEAYKVRVTNSKQRNTSLFQVACLARDNGHTEDWTLAVLGDLHAQMPAQDDHTPEGEQARYHEAERTIASAFSQPARPIFRTQTDEPASRLPNALRELVLQQSDGTATLRVLESLNLAGFKAGDVFTEDEIRQVLAGVVGHHSIRRALLAKCSVENPILEPFFWFCPTNKNASFCNELEELSVSALAGGGLEGELLPHRRKIQYEFPNIETVCTLLQIDLQRGDPIFAKDLKSAKLYRQALEREFIKRRPGQYTQAWLATRLGVSDRTIRRYHQAIPIHSCKMYDERLIHRWNIDTLPYDDERQGGWTLIDENGKVYPASREIAQSLMRIGYTLHLRIQQGNFYWYGDWEPHKERQLAPEYIKEPVLAPPLLVDRAPATLCVIAPYKDAIQPSESVKPPLPRLGANVVYVRPLDKPAQSYEQETVATLQKDRYYLQPLANEYHEYVAQDVYANIADLSIYNARRLVDLYGTAVVNATLSKTIAMLLKDKIYNPAGFMVTATEVAWRDKYGWITSKPSFKVQPPRRERLKPYAIEKDSLTKSEKWLRWRVGFAFEMGDFESLERWQARLRELNLPEEAVWDWRNPIMGEIPY